MKIKETIFNIRQKIGWMRHPEQDQIEKYISGELDEKESIAVGKHISKCNKCRTKVRLISSFDIIWESWNAKTHNIAYQMYEATKNSDLLKVKEKNLSQNIISIFKKKIIKRRRVRYSYAFGAVFSFVAIFISVILLYSPKDNNEWQRIDPTLFEDYFVKQKEIFIPDEKTEEFTGETPKISVLFDSSGTLWTVRQSDMALGDSSGTFWMVGQNGTVIKHTAKEPSSLKNTGNERPNAALRLEKIGNAYFSMGQYEKAIEYYEKALASDLKTYGSDHPDVATNWNSQGMVYFSMGHYERAVKHYDNALALTFKTDRNEHIDVGMEWNRLALEYNKLGKSKKALECYEKALKIFEALLGKDHPYTKSVIKSLRKCP